MILEIFMGVIFDLLLLLLFGFSVYMGYKNGFLVSASGIIAIILASVLTGIFELGLLGFIVLNILLAVAVALIARILRRLRLPVIRTADTLLGIGFGILEGFMRVVILALVGYFIARLTATAFFDGSLIIEYISNGAIYDFIRDFIVR